MGMSNSFKKRVEYCLQSAVAVIAFAAHPILADTGLTLPLNIAVMDLRTENIKKTGLPTIGKSILYVGGSGSGNYSTIQSAIDDATKDDNIFVYNGTYIETVVVDKSINLIGEDRDITIIDADETGIAVYITANFVNISGFTIKNGGGPSSFYVGLRIESENNTIYDNILIYNYENGIIVDGSSNIISGNKILSNKNGIFLDDSNNIISDNLIYSNNKNGIVIYTECSNNSILKLNFSSKDIFIIFIHLIFGSCILADLIK